MVQPGSAGIDPLNEFSKQLSMKAASAPRFLNNFVAFINTFLIPVS